MGYGRADPIRFLLHHANVDFEYVGYDFAKWGELKGSGKGGEFNGLPRVTIDGKEYGQSLAILRMLGAKHGYYTPSDWQCAARVDLFLDAWVDMLDKSTGLALSAGGGKDMAEVLKEHETVIKNVHEPAIKAMEAQLTEVGGPYLAGSKLTIADCCMVAMLANIWENPAGPFSAQFAPVLKNYPKVQAYNLKLREAFKQRLNDPARKPCPF